MKIPFIKIAEDLTPFPELVECADDLYVHVEELPEYTLYSVEGKFRAELIPVGKKAGFLSRLFGLARDSYKIRFSAPAAYELSELRDRLSALIDADDDCMTQYHETETLKYLLEQCRTFEEILSWGCLTGALVSTGHNKSLPQICEDVDTNSEDDAEELALITAPDYAGPLSVSNIRDKAALIVSDHFEQDLLC